MPLTLKTYLNTTINYHGMCTYYRKGRDSIFQIFCCNLHRYSSFFHGVSRKPKLGIEVELFVNRFQVVA